jgi:hypothetical protein
MSEAPRAVELVSPGSDGRQPRGIRATAIFAHQPGVMWRLYRNGFTDGDRFLDVTAKDEPGKYWVEKVRQPFDERQFFGAEAWASADPWVTICSDPRIDNPLNYEYDGVLMAPSAISALLHPTTALHLRGTIFGHIAVGPENELLVQMPQPAHALLASVIVERAIERV